MSILKKNIEKIINRLGYTVSKINSIENELLRGKYDWLINLKPNSIVDVGANSGGFAMKINKILPEARIHSFEPLHSVFDELKENTNNISNITYHNYALGNFEGELEINKNEFSPSSSFYSVGTKHTQAFPHTAKTEKEIVKVKMLDSIFNSLDLTSNVLLKLDVQGYELDVLKGGARSLNSVNIIIAEVSFYPLYIDQPLFKDVYSFLFERGFDYFGNFDQLVDPNDHRILQADAIFFKKDISFG